MAANDSVPPSTFASIVEALNTGAATSSPNINSLCSSAIKVFEIAQKGPNNQDEFMELAEESCRLVYSIATTLTDEQEIDQNLTDKLEKLSKALQSILTFGEKRALKGVLLREFDANEIKAQRQRLERLRLFEFHPLLELRGKMNQLVQQFENNQNTTDNKISFENDANSSELNGNVMGVRLANVINHNSNNEGGAGPSSTNNNNRINYNSNKRTGNAFGSDNTVNGNSDNRSGSHENNGNAQNNPQRNLTANVHYTNYPNNTIEFGDGANFGGSNGNVLGGNDHVNHNSNNVYDSSTNIHNNGSNNHTISHWGNKNQTHINNNDGRDTKINIIGNEGVAIGTLRAILPILLPEDYRGNQVPPAVDEATGVDGSSPLPSVDHSPQIGDETVRIFKIEDPDPSLTALRSVADRYTRSMLTCLRGYPLYEPQPYGDISGQYLRKGISVGDVGFIRIDGGFDFIFNICPLQSGSINPPHLPYGFTLEGPRYPAIKAVDSLPYKTRVFPDSISRKKKGCTKKYTCSASDGAILELPEGATQFEAIEMNLFKALATRYGAQWYEYTMMDRGRDVSNGSLYLVTSL